MPTSLTNSTFGDLEINLKRYGRKYYYSRLVELEYEEARLSRFVVTDTELIGRFSNRYAEAVAVDRDLDFEVLEWHAIGDVLAQSDLGERNKRIVFERTKKKLEGEPDSIFFDVSLGYDEYRRYHAVVFEGWERPNVHGTKVKLGKEAWSLEIVIGDAEKSLVAPLWLRLLDVEENTGDQLAAFRRVVYSALWNRKRQFGRRLTAIGKAVWLGFRPAVSSLMSDKCFYDPERKRRRP